jgi:hypothetical protein
MKGKVISGFTPQAKMVAVNNRFGNTNIKNQQGTTRVLFDSIALNGNTELRFFENAGLKQYPFTNIGSDGNRLSVGETFTIQKIYFAKATFDPDTGAITNFQTSLPGTLSIGEFSFFIANNQVIKQLPLGLFYNTGLNPTAQNNGDVALSTFTDIVIPPLLEFVAPVRLSNPLNAANEYLFCFIEGTAGILAPQTTF